MDAVVVGNELQVGREERGAVFVPLDPVQKELGNRVDLCQLHHDTLSHRGVTRRTVVLLLPAPEHGEFKVLAQKPAKEVGRVEVGDRILEFTVSPVRSSEERRVWKGCGGTGRYGWSRAQ